LLVDGLGTTGVRMLTFDLESNALPLRQRSQKNLIGERFNAHPACYVIMWIEHIVGKGVWKNTCIKAKLKRAAIKSGFLVTSGVLKVICVSSIAWSKGPWTMMIHSKPTCLAKRLVLELKYFNAT
jgi:hypothetical protein